MGHQKPSRAAFVYGVRAVAARCLCNLGQERVSVPVQQPVERGVFLCRPQKVICRHTMGIAGNLHECLTRRAVCIEKDGETHYAFVANRPHFYGSAVLHSVDLGDDAIPWKVDVAKRLITPGKHLARMGRDVLHTRQ